MKLQMYGLDIADTSIDPLEFNQPTHDMIAAALDGMILSSSGWRGVFADDGSEESRSQAISESHRFIAACVALAFADWLSLNEDGSYDDGGRAEILVGTDTRPTGPVIADVIIATLLGAGNRVRYTAIAAAPEIMAHAKTVDEIDAFVYVSASHNPVGHNGLKFGRGTGGVLQSGESESLRSRFFDIVSEAAREKTWNRILECRRIADRNSVYKRVEEEKRRALTSYSSFIKTVATGPVNKATAESVFTGVRESCAKAPLGILGELNGSARATSIDAAFLESLGIRTHFLNDRPGAIAHRIVPEGESLDTCRDALEELHAGSSAFQIGYVPDNDGDRGNLVFIDEASGESHPIHAQEVFALSCVAELAYLATVDEDATQMERTAIVVNGPTSMRVERIADAFGASVFRCEVGESHGVSRAAELRAQGWRVRIFGEGSNGGTIIHPSSVRDPLGTIASIVKLLRLPPIGDRESPLAIWSNLIGLTDECPATVGAMLRTLPHFTTTGAYEDRAIMRVKVPDHGKLKSAYERRFPDEWDSRSAELKERFGFVSWRVINYESTRELPGIGNRDVSGSERGGLKVVFTNTAGNDAGFIWMRGSATEPVFRVLADLEGDDTAGESDLLEWQKSMILAAL